MMQILDWTREHIEAFAPSVDASPFAPVTDLASALDGSNLLEWRQDGERALIAVKRTAWPLGNRLDVVGLVSDGERIQSGRAIEALRQFAHAHQVNYITMMTRRDHVARACARAGWIESGVAMVQRVNHV